MSESHLKQIRLALERSGWNIAERVRGDDGVIGAATWEIRRGSAASPLLIDFAGLGPMGEDISLEESYACHVRGKPDCDLYFRRINHSRDLWLNELEAFVASLDIADDV